MKGLSMADVVNIVEYLRSCDNCVYHNKEFGACMAPDGPRYDHKARVFHCSFKRKVPIQGEVTNGKPPVGGGVAP